jgi:hypothetical protein
MSIYMTGFNSLLAVGAYPGGLHSQYFITSHGNLLSYNTNADGALFVSKGVDGKFPMITVSIDKAQVNSILEATAPELKTKKDKLTKLIATVKDLDLSTTTPKGVNLISSILGVLSDKPTTVVEKEIIAYINSSLTELKSSLMRNKSNANKEPQQLEM